MFGAPPPRGLGNRSQDTSEEEGRDRPPRELGVLIPRHDSSDEEESAQEFAAGYRLATEDDLRQLQGPAAALATASLAAAQSERFVAGYNQANRDRGQCDFEARMRSAGEEGPPQQQGKGVSMVPMVMGATGAFSSAVPPPQPQQQQQHQREGPQDSQEEFARAVIRKMIQEELHTQLGVEQTVMEEVQALRNKITSVDTSLQVLVSGPNNVDHRLQRTKQDIQRELGPLRQQLSALEGRIMELENRVRDAERTLGGLGEALSGFMRAWAGGMTGQIDHIQRSLLGPFRQNLQDKGLMRQNEVFPGGPTVPQGPQRQQRR